MHHRAVQRLYNLYFLPFCTLLLYHFVLSRVLLNFQIYTISFLIILQQYSLKCFVIPDVCFGPAPFIFNVGSAIKFRSLSIPDHAVIG